MKARKIFLVLLVTSMATLFSSCIVISNCGFHNITCHNTSDERIQDWYVIKNGQRFVSKLGSAPISANGGTATMYNLTNGECTVYVSFYNSSDKYVATKSFYLDKDYDIYIDQTFADNNQ